MSCVVEKSPPPAFGKPVDAIAQRLGQETDIAPSITILLPVGAIGAGQPGKVCVARPEGGFRHSQRIEEARLEKLLVRHAADDLDDACGNIHALIAISVLVARLPLEWTRHRTESARFQRSAVRPRDLLKLGRTGQAAGVAEHEADRDGANRGFQEEVGIVFFFDNHPFLEQRDVLAHGIVQTDLAFVHEHHDGGTGEHLRHRRDPEDVVFTDRILRFDIRVSEQVLVVNLPALIGNDADDSRQFVLIEIRLKRRRDFGTGWRVAVGSHCGCRRCDQHQAQRDGCEKNSHVLVSL